MMLSAATATEVAGVLPPSRRDGEHTAFLRGLRGNTTLRTLGLSGAFDTTSAAAALGEEIAAAAMPTHLPALRRVILNDYLLCAGGVSIGATPLALLRLLSRAFAINPATRRPRSPVCVFVHDFEDDLIASGAGGAALTNLMELAHDRNGKNCTSRAPSCGGGGGGFSGPQLDALAAGALWGQLAVRRRAAGEEPTGLPEFAVRGALLR